MTHDQTIAIAKLAMLHAGMHPRDINIVLAEMNRQIDYDDLSDVAVRASRAMYAAEKKAGWPE